LISSRFASYQYGSTSQDSFTEDGGLNLEVNPNDVSVSEFGIGVNFIAPLTQSEIKSNLRLQAGYYYDFSDEGRDLDISLNGENFTLNGNAASQGSFVLEAGIDIIPIEDTLIINFGYQGEYSSDFDSHTGQIGVLWAF